MRVVVLSDCWVFNIEEKVWRKLGEYDGRWAHTSCEFGDEVFIFGGMIQLVVSQRYFSYVKQGGLFNKMHVIF